MKRRAAWICTGLLVATAFALLIWLLQDPAKVELFVAGVASADRHVRGASSNTGSSAAAGAPVAVTTPDVADPIGAAPDLKQVFDEYRESADPRLRRVAARAFGACVPVFLAATAQTPSPEPLIQALPKEHRAEREAAYRSLFARCRNFLGNGREKLQDVQQEFQASPETLDLGVRAQRDLLAGRSDRLDAWVAQGLVARDPAAVASLSGVASALASAKTSTTPDAALVQRATGVDAALVLVACDLGLDCSPASTAALQLCAGQGLCDGDLAARMMRSTGESVAPALIERERARLLALIRGGRNLGTSDLLP